MSIGQVISLLLGIALALLGVVIILGNWMLWIGAQRGAAAGSPVIGAGPLLLLLSGGQLARSLPAAWVHLWWVLGVMGLAVDPAALPLLLRLLCRTSTGGKRH